MQSGNLKSGNIKNLLVIILLIIATVALIIFAYLNRDLTFLTKEFLYSNPLQNEILQKTMSSKSLQKLLKSKNCSHFFEVSFIPTSNFTKQIATAPNELQMVLENTLDESCPLKLEMLLFENLQADDESAQKLVLNIQYSVKEKSENVLLEEALLINLN